MSVMCTIAIDFGTAYSGYAYGLTEHHQDVQRLKRWQRSSGADTAKTPTCILFDHRGTFQHFGYKARERYYEICKDTNNYYYFKDCKMELCKQTTTKDLKIEDVNNKSMSAMKVFSAALRFLKEDALKTIIKETKVPLDLLDFTWVLTVPAIWDFPARQFMREAAIQAGIDPSSHKLVIALESEAASVWCKQLSAEDFLLDTDNTTEVMMTKGTQYVVVDCGGGTIDITVHEVLEGGELKELHKALGNDKGGQTVDRKFTWCMRQFFCDGLWTEYERDEPKEVQNFMDDFIFFKQTDQSHVRQLDFGVKFREMLAKRRKKSNRPLFLLMDGLTFHLKQNSAKLEISQRIMESFLHDTMSSITGYIREILQKLGGVRYILLVGGLSSSHMLREHVRREFRHKCKVLCPRNPQDVILKGAVMFGRDQSLIRSRKSAFTYGFSKIMRFDPQIHKEEKKVVTKDGVWCRHLFRKIVEVNEDVEFDETRGFSIYPLEGDQRKISFDFYRTKKKHPVYVDEKGVEGPVASCDVMIPKGFRSMDHEVKLKIYFGFTTITAEATDVQSQSTVETTMDFKSQLPVFSPAPTPIDTPPGFPPDTPPDSPFPNRSSLHSSSRYYPVDPKVPTYPESQSRGSSRHKETPTMTKQPSGPLDQPTSASTDHSTQRKSISAEKEPALSTKHPYVASDGRTSASTDHSTQRKSRPAEKEPASSTKHPYVASDERTSASTDHSTQRKSRPAERAPSTTPINPSVPSDQHTQASSYSSTQRNPRAAEKKSTSSTKHPPGPSEQPLPYSTHLLLQKSKSAAIDSSLSPTHGPGTTDQPAPATTHPVVQQGSEPEEELNSFV